MVLTTDLTTRGPQNLRHNRHEFCGSLLRHVDVAHLQEILALPLGMIIVIHRTPREGVVGLGNNLVHNSGRNPLPELGGHGIDECRGSPDRVEGVWRVV